MTGPKVSLEYTLSNIKLLIWCFRASTYLESLFNLRPGNTRLGKQKEKKMCWGSKKLYS